MHPLQHFISEHFNFQYPKQYKSACTIIEKWNFILFKIAVSSMTINIYETLHNPKKYDMWSQQKKTDMLAKSLNKHRIITFYKGF